MRFFTVCIAALFAGLVPAPAMANLMEGARGCAQETNRLERLACYDDLFGMPTESAREARLPRGNQPERWRQAFAQAGERQAVVYRNTGDAAGHLVTVGALGTPPPRPLLVLQCHNNITELALMLPSALNAERITLDLGSGQADWRVRGGGYLVSGGRGLPAIRSIKAMTSVADITLTANTSELDGLVFDLSGFSDAIQPLRSACGW